MSEPTTKAGRALLLSLGQRFGGINDTDPIRTAVLAIEAEVREDLARQVAALPHADVRGDDLAEPGEGDAMFVDADEWADVVDRAAVLALLETK